MIRHSAYYIVTLLLFLFAAQLQAQVATPEEARAALEERGIDYDELERRLIAKGVDMQNLDNLSPTEVVAMESLITETIDEMEREKAEKLSNQNKPVDRQGTIFPFIRQPDTIKVDTIIPPLDSLATVDSLLDEEVEPDFVESRIFGQHLFLSNAIPVYEATSRILPSDAYKLSTGDAVAISIYGASQFEGQFIIDAAGYIYPARGPRVFLKGLSLADTRDKLQKVFSSYYRFGNGEFNVAISATRNVTIGVFGNAEKIGSYSLTAQNTAINAIAAAGGPSSIGSVRKIRLHRGEEIKYIDLYAFMSNPSVSQDYYLEDNDIIQIPEAEKIVTLNGEVRKPYIFELLPDENLIDVLRYAGGLTEIAYTDNIQIKRKAGDAYRIHDVNLADILSRNGDYVLNAGDEITIRAIRGQLNEVVYLEGQVNYPGQFDLSQNMTIAELIKKGVPNAQSRKDIALLYRLNADSTYDASRINLAASLDNPQSKENVALKTGDRLQIFGSTDLNRNYTFSVEGNVRKPGSFPLDKRQSLRVNDAILLSNGLFPNVYETGMILRTPVDNPMKKEWISFNVVNAIGDANSVDNVLLEPNDKVFIYSNDNYSDEYQLSSNGAVRDEITAPYGRGVRISDLIILSNGVKSDASDKGYIVRYNLKNKNEELYIPVDIEAATTQPGSDSDILLDPGDRLFVFSTTELTEKFFVNIGGEVRNPGEYIYSPTMSLKSILLLAGGLKFAAATNRVEIFRLIFAENKPVKKALISVVLDSELNIVGQDDIQLEPFDIVMVRRIPGFELHERIELEGEFTYPGQYALLNDNERITDLVERSGGFTREAYLPAAKLYRNEDDKGYVIIRLDEIMRNRNSEMNIRLKSGDRLIVPKSEELVVIRGAVDLESTVLDEIAEEGKINVAFIGRKRAMSYINQFTGGLDDNTSKKYVKVKYPNGAINKSKRFLFFRTTPRVEAGAEIIVDEKPPEVIKEKEDKERERVDWGKVVSNSIAQAGAILSLILLIQRVD